MITAAHNGLKKGDCVLARNKSYPDTWYKWKVIKIDKTYAKLQLIDSNDLNDASSMRRDTKIDIFVNDLLDFPKIIDTDYNTIWNQVNDA